MRTQTVAKYFAAVLMTATMGAAFGAADRNVTIYDPTQLALGDFTVVERIGIGSWRSALGVSGFPTEDAARNAVVARAAEAGADGVTNLKCMSQTDGIFNSSGFYCYANAIRLKNERRAP